MPELLLAQGRVPWFFHRCLNIPLISSPLNSYVFSLFSYHPRWRGVSPINHQTVSVHDGELLLPTTPYYHSPSVMPSVALLPSAHLAEQLHIHIFTQGLLLLVWFQKRPEVSLDLHPSLPSQDHHVGRYLILFSLCFAACCLRVGTWS